MKHFFVISYSFVEWMIKKRLPKFVFNMTDSEFPNYKFIVTVERIKNG